MENRRYIDLTSKDEIEKTFQDMKAHLSLDTIAGQWDAAQKDLADIAQKRWPLSYRVLVDCLRRCAATTFPIKTRKVLEIGAGCAQHREMLAQINMEATYVAADFWEELRRFVTARLSGFEYHVIGESTPWPWGNGEFDIVILTWSLSKVPEWRKFLGEAIRVGRTWILLHRVPFVLNRKTCPYRREGLSVSLEIRFNEAELIGALREAGLRLAHTQQIFQDGDGGHRSYLCRKF